MHGPGFTVGRMKKNKLRISCPSASNKHLSIDVLDGCLYVEDLSTHGTSALFPRDGSLARLERGQRFTVPSGVALAIPAQRDQDKLIRSVAKGTCNILKFSLLPLLPMYKRIHVATSNKLTLVQTKTHLANIFAERRWPCDWLSQATQMLARAESLSGWRSLDCYWILAALLIALKFGQYSAWREEAKPGKFPVKAIIMNELYHRVAPTWIGRQPEQHQVAWSVICRREIRLFAMLGYRVPRVDEAECTLELESEVSASLPAKND